MLTKDADSQSPESLERFDAAVRERLKNYGFEIIPAPPELPSFEFRVQYLPTPEIIKAVAYAMEGEAVTESDIVALAEEAFSEDITQTQLYSPTEFPSSLLPVAAEHGVSLIDGKELNLIGAPVTEDDFEFDLPPLDDGLPSMDSPELDLPPLETSPADLPPLEPLGGQDTSDSFSDEPGLNLPELGDPKPATEAVKAPVSESREREKTGFQIPTSASDDSFAQTPASPPASLPDVAAPPQEEAPPAAAEPIQQPVIANLSQALTRPAPGQMPDLDDEDELPSATIPLKPMQTDDDDALASATIPIQPIPGAVNPVPEAAEPTGGITAPQAHVPPTIEHEEKFPWLKEGQNSYAQPVQPSPVQPAPMQTAPLPGHPMQTGPLPGQPGTAPLPIQPVQTGPLPGYPTQTSQVPGQPIQTGPLPGYPAHTGTVPVQHGVPTGPLPGQVAGYANAPSITDTVDPSLTEPPTVGKKAGNPGGLRKALHIGVMSAAALVMIGLLYQTRLYTGNFLMDLVDTARNEMTLEERTAEVSPADLPAMSLPIISSSPIWANTEQRATKDYFLTTHEVNGFAGPEIQKLGLKLAERYSKEIPGFDFDDHVDAVKTVWKEVDQHPRLASALLYDIFDKRIRVKAAESLIPEVEKVADPILVFNAKAVRAELTQKPEHVQDAIDAAADMLYETDGLSELPASVRVAILCDRPASSLYEENGAEFVDAVEGSTALAPWLKKLVRGQYHIANARKGRSENSAASVLNPEWWSFHDELMKARLALRESWELEPGEPFAAALMIEVATALHLPHEDPRAWFDRAIDAQGDYPKAYDLYLRSLSPECGGSDAELAAFGIACLETRAFNTCVPLKLLESHQLRARSWPDEEDYWKNRSDKEIHDLEDMIQGYVEASGSADLKNYYKSLDVAIAYVTGKQRRARTVLVGLMDNFDGYAVKDFSFDTTALFSALRVERLPIAQSTSPDGEQGDNE